jgi:acyl-coenzyme A synthetase/AMP-(fatty) acid ligase
LRSALSSSLPSYMLPARWEAMDALPKNVNGKIDRRRLRELFSDSEATMADA